MFNEQGKNILPEDFDGIFRFTNWTNAEFKAKWDSKEYTFPANSTIPLIIPNATPIEIQSIRKKFAKELAIEIFFQSEKFKSMNAPEKQLRSYDEDKDLKEYIQKCLTPLPIAKAKVRELPKDSEDNYRKDEKGRNRSKVLTDDESLIPEGSMPIK
jgi:hypothetical protein